MKISNLLKTLSIFSLISFIVISSSCKKNKDQQIPPKLSFKTGTSYISGDATVKMNDTLLVGVIASKTEDKDLLTRFVGTQQYDANSATTIINESFNEDTYSKDFNIITRKVAGMEKYTYTIINRDGLTQTISFVLTVK
ncbi:MAG: hypothetical protein ABI315_04210 [Bacteroidia bacterium]